MNKKRAKVFRNLSNKMEKIIRTLENEDVHEGEEIVADMCDRLTEISIAMNFIAEREEK